MHHSPGLLMGTAALLLSFLCSPAKAQVTFKPFEDFCFITDMSADGSVAVGTYDNGRLIHDVFRWTAAGGVELIGVRNQSDRLLISRDGKTVVGNLPDSQGKLNAAIWQGGRNWRILAPFPGAVAGENNIVSSAQGVSADGSVIVGQAYVDVNKAVAFRWDAMNGMVNLGMFEEGANNYSYANAVSGDGRTVIGWDSKYLFVPGPGGEAMNERRGAIWWDGKERLLHPFGWAGEALATNDVGSIIVGQFAPTDTNNQIAHGASTYRWTAWDGHFEDLGAVAIPIGGNQRNYVSQPYAVSDDGSVIGGVSGLLEKFAMIWTWETGMMYVSDYLTLKGVTEHKNWVSLTKTTYISPDGRIVAGNGFLPPGPTSPFNVPRSWVMTLR